MNTKGVTLIELLIVMIILAIMSVVIFLSMTGALDDADRTNERELRATAPSPTVVANLSPGGNSTLPGTSGPSLTGAGSVSVPSICAAANSSCDVALKCCAGLQCCNGTCLTECVTPPEPEETCADVKESCAAAGCCSGLVCCGGTCAESCVATSEGDCDDGMDNDLDSRTDCDDSDCDNAQNCKYTCGQQQWCSSGTCPPEETCKLQAGSCTCMAEETGCGDITDIDSCNEGACDSDEECVAVSSRECDCIPKDEHSCSYMSSDNYCPMGDCPRGESCQATSDGCECVPEEQEYSCSTPGRLACDEQSCPSGQKCAGVSQSECECIPEDSYSCDYISDRAYCGNGECQRGYYCAVGAKACYCQPEIV